MTEQPEIQGFCDACPKCEVSEGAGTITLKPDASPDGKTRIACIRCKSVYDIEITPTFDEGDWKTAWGGGANDEEAQR